MRAKATSPPDSWLALECARVRPIGTQGQGKRHLVRLPEVEAGGIGHEADPILPALPTSTPPSTIIYPLAGPSSREDPLGKRILWEKSANISMGKREKKAAKISSSSDRMV